MTTKLLALYGLKFHPFNVDISVDMMLAGDAFLRCVELTFAGDIAVLTGDPDTGKAVALRRLAEGMDALPGTATTNTKPTLGAET